MREYKFRGKRPFNGEWVYGFLMNWEGKRPSIFVQNGDVDEETGDVDYTDYTVDPETVGQYTGRKDKNKEEIYEGDILTCPDILNYKPCVVRFGIHNDAYNGWYVDWGNMQGELNESWSDMGLKIGNEWDNPEMLKEVE